MSEWQMIHGEGSIHREDFELIALIAVGKDGEKAAFWEFTPREISQVESSIQFLCQTWRTDTKSLQIKYVAPASNEPVLLEKLKKSQLNHKGRVYKKRQSVEFFVLSNGTIRISLKDAENGRKGLTKELKKVEPIRVLVVDDSPTIRKLLRRAIGLFPDLQVVGDTGQPKEVFQLVKDLKPDVLTLDIHMPDMNGVEVLQELYKTTFVPAVVVSSLNMNEGSLAMQALEVGAIDYVKKIAADEFDEISQKLVEKLRLASKQKKSHHSNTTSSKKIWSSQDMDRIDYRKCVVIGASTGGTEAIKEVLRGLPDKIPPVLIAQHIPPFFSTAFAKRLDELTPFEVREGVDGDLLKENQVLIAPGGHHMRLVKSGQQVRVQVREEPPIGGHVPSVDTLFQSVAQCLGCEAIGVLLTGMGRDGASGLKELKSMGAFTVAQDEESSVVYGMPKAAMQIDAASVQLPLSQVAGEVTMSLMARRSIRKAS